MDSRVLRRTHNLTVFLNMHVDVINHRWARQIGCATFGKYTNVLNVATRCIVVESFQSRAPSYNRVSYILLHAIDGTNTSHQHLTMARPTGTLRGPTNANP